MRGGAWEGASLFFVEMGARSESVAYTIQTTVYSES